MIIPVYVIKSGPGNAENGICRKSNFKLFKGGECPQTPKKFLPLVLMFAPLALTSACFTYESDTLKCYRKPCISITYFCIKNEFFSQHAA